MNFAQFAEFLQRLEQTSGRLEMTAILAELYQALDPVEIKPASYLMQGSLVPAYQSLEFQLSNKMVIRALSRLQANYSAAGVSGDKYAGAAVGLFGEEDLGAITAEVEKAFKKYGDLGLVAEEIAAAGQSDDLSLLDVYNRLYEIAGFAGGGSQERKVAGLVDLLSGLTPLGVKFAVRIVIGKLRLGFSTMTMLDALSWAVTSNKEHHDILEAAYQKRADVGELAEFYLMHRQQLVAGQDAATMLEDYTVEVGVPVVPALCQRLNSTEEIIEKMGKVLAEPKYDGLRIQIHFIRGKNNQSDQVTAFTRNLEDISHMFPELNKLGRYLNSDRCILDAEAIGYDPVADRLLTFQQTITRKRKHGIDEAAQKVPVRFYVFDILKADNESLINKPLEERKKVLQRVLQANSQFINTPTLESSDPGELREYHEELLKEGLEGAVMKQLGSNYQSGRKGWKWVKIKETEGTRGKLSDTLDLIVLGYYSGRGKRIALGIGAFLVGTVEDAGSEEIKTIAKIGTGLTDEQFLELRERLQPLESPSKPSQYDVPAGLVPDVWVQPKLVVEIAADEITKSPIHTAGIALRFPRLVKFRDDKTWEQATTIVEMKQII